MRCGCGFLGRSGWCAAAMALHLCGAGRSGRVYTLLRHEDVKHFKGMLRKVSWHTQLKVCQILPGKLVLRRGSSRSAQSAPDAMIRTAAGRQHLCARPQAGQGGDGGAAARGGARAAGDAGGDFYAQRATACKACTAYAWQVPGCGNRVHAGQHSRRCLLRALAFGFYCQLTLPAGVGPGAGAAARRWGHAAAAGRAGSSGAG